MLFFDFWTTKTMLYLTSCDLQHCLVLLTSLISLLLFSSLSLPTSAFPFAHIVGSLTFKLPSAIWSRFGRGTKRTHAGNTVLRFRQYFREHFHICSIPTDWKMLRGLNHQPQQSTKVSCEYHSATSSRRCSYKI